MSEPRTKTWKASRGGLAVDVRGDYPHSGGFIVTPHGVVGFYAQRDYTSLTIVHAGQEHRRVWEREITEIGRKRLARQFAKEIAQ